MTHLARGIVAAVFLGSLPACAQVEAPAHEMSLPPLPEPVANNAVAAVHTPRGVYLVSFLGLFEGKTWRDVTNEAWVLAPGAAKWSPIAAPPGPGRLAATATAVGDSVFLFGGYTVAADGSEKSIETVHAVDVVAGRYEAWPAMPVPVDDALSAPWRERYIYLVSGWHDTGNVNLVQVLDTRERRWFQATPYPGVPLFGHAGGVAGDRIVVCGGVKIVSSPGKRSFAAERACYIGAIDANNPAKIDWSTLEHHPGPALYRAAATGRGHEIVIAGGSDNPYNYNGVGYDGEPSTPSASVFVFDTRSGRWREGGDLPAPSMDHRGLLDLGDGRFAIVGGMGAGQSVTARVAIVEPH